MRSPASSALLINFISIVDAIQSINMFSTSAILMFAAISSILPHTSAAPFESPNLAKRDGAMFTLTGNLPGWSNAPIQARDSMFFIGGGGPKTSCPPGEQCPATEKTVFQCVADNTNTTCYLVGLFFLPSTRIVPFPPRQKVVLTSYPRPPKVANSPSTSTSTALSSTPPPTCTAA